MSPSLEPSSFVHPTLHHFGVETRHLEQLVDWYGKVVGMVTVGSTAPGWGSGSAVGMPAAAAFVSNDRAHHRMAIFEVPHLQEDTDKGAHVKLQHVAFEYATLDDLLTSYVRIKSLGIEPVLTMDRGPTIAFYYQDPDRNSAGLFADTLGDWDQSRQFTQSSPEFHQNPLGAPVDADQLVAARQAGMSFAELPQRAPAGEFQSAYHIDPCMLL
jgi:catechol 2,3-dioxygenase